MPDKQDCYIGLMSGTSMDGVNAAAVAFDDSGPQLLAAAHQPYPSNLQHALEQLINAPHVTDLQILLALDHQIAVEFSNAALRLQTQQHNVNIIAIGSHGQTVYHLPDNTASPNSWQLGDPSLIAERTGITTIADWRRRDMAAGGQGAPLTPAFHNHFLRTSHDIAILNLGGIANITFIPGTNSESPPVGFDTGPANTLMDQWIHQSKGAAYDNKGAWASSGTVDKKLLSIMLKDVYFHTQPPKSTGRERFNLDWLQAALTHLSVTPVPEDIQATLAELTAKSVAQSVIDSRQYYRVAQLYVCGGGIHNRYLIGRLKALLPGIKVNSTEKAGVDPDYMEAMAFAWMASQTLNRIPIDMTCFTGAHHPRILGGVYYA